MPQTAPNLLRAALAAAERGWPVFPIRPGDKRPAGHPETACPGTGRCADGHRTPEQRATTDPDIIARCWQGAPYNVGIATGPAGLVVVDLDIPKDGSDTPPAGWEGMTDGLDVFAALAERAGQQMPTETFTVRTRHGGQHLYFAAPGDKRLRSTAGALGWKVDTRAWGGYVVAGGSVVDHRPYQVIHDAPPMPLPAWLLEQLTPRPAPAPVPLAVLRDRVKDVNAYTEAAVAGELEKVQSARQGGRNKVLYTAAYALSRFIRTGDLTEGDLTATLSAAGQNAGLSEGECRTAIRSGIHRGTHRTVSAA